MRENAFEQLPEGFMPIFLGVMAFVLVAVMIIYALYLKNLQDLLKEVRESNRRIAPGMVWLVMLNFLNVFFVFGALNPATLGNINPTLLVIGQYAVSLFVIVWNFYMVNKIAESVEAEYASRNVTPEERRPTWQTGVIMCGCQVAGLLSGVPYLSFIGTLAGLVGFVFWIMYWVKTNSYKHKLRALPPEGDRDSMIFGDYR